MCLLLLVARATGADALDAGFAAPPPIARPLVWWHWINGNVSKHGIEADLADMKRVGIAGDAPLEFWFEVQTGTGAAEKSPVGRLLLK